MVFRDDIGALRARCDALELELEQSHREQSKLLEEAAERDLLEAKADELQRQLDELRSQIHQNAPPGSPEPLPPPKSMALFAATMVVLVGGFTLHILAATHQRQMSAYHYRTMTERARAIEAQRELDTLRYAMLQVREEKGLVHSPLLFETEYRTGRVVRAVGRTPINSGDSCTVELISTREYHEFNCRAEVRCGSTMVYGGPELGYMMCGFEDYQATYARDQGGTSTDGDPRLTLDLIRNEVVVSDGPQPRYSIEISLDEQDSSLPEDISEDIIPCL